jgi:hypothetical protein
MSRWAGAASPHISTFVHRELFLELKGYDSNFMYSGDYDFFARALRHGSFTRIRRILTGVRHHGANPEHGPGSEALRESKAMVAESLRGCGPGRTQRVTDKFAGDKN